MRLAARAGLVLAGLAALGMSAAGVAGAQAYPSSKSSLAEEHRAAVGQRAPGFSRLDLSGKPVSLGALRGRVVLLNFWATWCGPCLVEMPWFVKWEKEISGLAVVGVAMDDEAAPVRDLAAHYGLNYPVVMGDARLAERYGGVYGLPVTLLIDRAGVVRFRHAGAVDVREVEAEIRGLL